METLLAIVVGLAFLLLCMLGPIIWLGRRDQGYRINKRKNAVFVALKGADSPLPLKAGAKVLWQSRGDLPLIGTPEGDGFDSYWDYFAIIERPDGQTGSPLDGVNAGAEDAYIAKLKLTQIPAFAPGLLRFLYLTGIRRAPADIELHDEMFDTLGRPEIMPSKDRSEALLAGPAHDRPAMVNFLKYYDQARYDGGDSNRDGGTGAQAYQRYGKRALESVYRVGGNLVFYGHVAETIRDADHAPTRDAWDDIAVMQYPNRKAILTMEQWDYYKEGFAHRDAGIDQTRLISSYPDKL